METFKSASPGVMYFLWRDFLRSVFFMLLAVMLLFIFDSSITTESIISICIVILILGLLNEPSTKRMKDVSFDGQDGLIKFEIHNLYSKFAENVSLVDVRFHLNKGKSKMPFSAQHFTLYIDNKKDNRTLFEISDYKDGFTNQTIQSLFDYAKQCLAETKETNRNPII